MNWTDEEAWAWLAGLYEGEGSCVLRRRSAKRFLVYISITSTDEDVIRRAPELSGLGRVYGPYTQGDSALGQKPRWRWVVVKSSDVLVLIDKLEPFLGERRRAKMLEARDELRAHLAAKGPRQREHGRFA